MEENWNRKKAEWGVEQDGAIHGPLEQTRRKRGKARWVIGGGEEIPLGAGKATLGRTVKWT